MHGYENFTITTCATHTQHVSFVGISGGNSNSEALKADLINAYLSAAAKHSAKQLRSGTQKHHRTAECVESSALNCNRIQTGRKSLLTTSVVSELANTVHAVSKISCVFKRQTTDAAVVEIVL